MRRNQSDGNREAITWPIKKAASPWQVKTRQKGKTVSILQATPMPGQQPFLGRVAAPARTFDPSTGQPVPDYSEPVFSSGGAPDELSAFYAGAYAAAHAELAEDDAGEIESLRNEFAALDWSPAQFLDYLRDRCPGLIATCSAFAYVHLDCLPDHPAVSGGYEARAKFPDGSPLRHVTAGSWRELAARLKAEYLARKGMGKPLPIRSYIRKAERERAGVKRRKAVHA
jgi:hypothetical protein